MFRFRDVKLRIKMIIGFLVMVIFIVIAGGAGYIGLIKIKTNLNDILLNRMPNLELLIQTDRDLHQLIAAERAMIFSNPKSDIFKELVNEYQENLKTAESQMRIYKEKVLSPEETDILQEFESIFKDWKALSKRVVDGRTEDTRDGRREALDLTLGKARERFDDMRVQLSKLTELNISLSHSTRDEALQTYRSAVSVVMGVIILSLIAAAAMAVFISQSVANPVLRASDGLKDIAEGEGDLTVRLKAAGKDEVGDLIRWFNIFIDKLHDIIKDIAGNADVMNTSSKGLSELSAFLAKGAEEVSEKANTVNKSADNVNTVISSVASAVEQVTQNANIVASATEEMTATIHEIAKSTEKARLISENAVSQVESATSGVAKLGAAAKEIEAVTEVITEISEQTNLLSLNATIEAARAGEAGKGFAVVANEIKALARQTSEATQNIKEKIEGIQSSTSTTVSDIEGITSVINEVNDIVATIAASVEEQSATTNEIASNIVQISTGIQSVSENISQCAGSSTEIAEEMSTVNAAVSEMTNNCSQVKKNTMDIAKLASALKDKIGVFKVNRG
ncbi:MAG: MCP four helix bundle domain-containing protein [Proteobacteria bacterium]|nr:MCP four helix bundle domain-containing protein [Pseudomonadota bacterium]